MKGIRITPSSFIGTLGGFIAESLSSGIVPQVASRQMRDCLRVSQGGTLAPLSSAIELVREQYQLVSRVVTIQYATVKVLELMTNHPIAVSCMKAYKEGLERVGRSKIYRGIREQGSPYQVSNYGRPLTIWAFNEKTADEIEGISPQLGLTSNRAVQIFLCGVLLTCEDALDKELLDELREEYRRGLTYIALYDYVLRFDEKAYIM